jgi:hypothetical protein
MSKSTVKKLQETEQQKAQRVEKEIQKILLMNDMTLQPVADFKINLVSEQRMQMCYRTHSSTFVASGGYMVVHERR